MQATLETIIQFGDCDEAGIVFYPRYFYWMDCAFQGLLRAQGWNQRKLRSLFETAGTPLVKATANFVSPASYDDNLTVSAGLARWGNTSFEISYTGKVDGRTVFHGSETRVWLVQTGGRPRSGPVPDAFRKKLGEATEVSVT